MLKHYLTTAIRSLLKNKMIACINILGLSIGLACCMLILLFIKDELSFDGFHENKNNLYQLTCNRIEKDGSHQQFAIAAMVQGPAFKKEIPEIAAFVRVYQKELLVRKNNEVFSENITWVDSNFFSVFTFPLIRGNKATALSSLQSVVITPETAIKYFGNMDVIGKNLQVEINSQFETFVVSAIARNPPPNSSIQFNILLPFDYLERSNPDNGWMWVSFPTYFLLHPGAETKSIAAKMKNIYQIQAGSEIEMNHQASYDNTFTWGLQPLTTMHLDTTYSGQPFGSDLLYTYILSGIALFILAIACINFVNLTIAGSLQRSKEIGIRKAAGGQNNQLRLQFMGESMLLCFFSFVLAMLFSQWLLPFFNSITGKRLSLLYLFDWKLMSCLILLFLLSSFLSGFYPALVLSALNPVTALYQRNPGGVHHRLLKSLVLLQFAIASFFITGTRCMQQQFNFLTRSDIGYPDKNLVEFTEEKAVMDKRLMNLIKIELSKIPGIESIGYTNVGKFGGKTEAAGKSFTSAYLRVDENYLSVLQPGFISGRNFSRSFPTDSTESVIVNESFIKTAGWQTGAGKTIDGMSLPGWGNKKVIIIGVVKDFHFESLKEKIRPLVLTMDQRLPMGRFIMRLHSNYLAGTLHEAEILYHKLVPGNPFLYEFKENINRKNYDTEYRWKQVIGFAAFLTICISCTGLFALAMLSVQRRSKEISIRKVLGASVIQMISMVTIDFIKPVLLAFCMAVPVSWFVIQKWMQNFAYHINLTWWLFGWAALMIISVAFITVSFHAIKIALSKPAVTLRSD